MSFALLFALLAPFMYAMTNVLDKYILAHRVRRAWGYIALTGLVNIAFAVIVGLLLDWSEVAPSALLFPIIAGVVGGLQTYCYLLVLHKEDVSYMLGFMFLYPALIAVASYFLLGEIIALWGYLGMLLILVGAVLLSIRFGKVKGGAGWWLIAGMTVLTAANVFLIKVSSSAIPALQGTVALSAAFGVTLLASVAHPRVWREFSKELHNVHWAAISEAFTMVGIACMFFAMALPATIVASLAGIRPLIVLMMERFVDTFGRRISRDHLLLPKLVPILLIVLGVVLIYATAP